MERSTVTFYDEISEKIKRRAEKNGNQSFSQAIRELVELALKVEEAAEKSVDGTKEIDGLAKALSELKRLSEINMSWSLETRFLSRFLVDNQPNIDSEKKLEALKTYKEKAQQHVKGLIGETED
jgi:predicted CopG family antitoxin